MWVTDPKKYDYWEKALQWDSAQQVRHLHDFLAAVEWWRLGRAHELVRTQPADVTRRVALAKSAEGDLAVAYLPANNAVEIDLSTFPRPVAARWFDPAHGRFIGEKQILPKAGASRFAPPAEGDWVLLLQTP